MSGKEGSKQKSRSKEKSKEKSKERKKKSKGSLKEKSKGNSKERSKRSLKEESKDKGPKCEKSKKEKGENKKVQAVLIDFEKPKVKKAQEHVQFSKNVETMEIAANIPPPVELADVGQQDAKYDEKVWNKEVLIKETGKEKKGHHIDHVSPTIKGTDTDATAHFPFDEVAMKHSGFVDCHCHHLTECEMHPKKPKLQATPHVNIISVVDAINVPAELPSSVPSSTSSVGSEATSVNDEVLISLRETIIKGDNLLDELRYKHEYIEYRVGDKGRAMVVWHDGTENTYDFSGETTYQINRET